MEKNLFGLMVLIIMAIAGLGRQEIQVNPMVKLVIIVACIVLAIMMEMEHSKEVKKEKKAEQSKLNADIRNKNIKRVEYEIPITYKTDRVSGYVREVPPINKQPDKPKTAKQSSKLGNNPVIIITEASKQQPQNKLLKQNILDATISRDDPKYIIKMLEMLHEREDTTDFLDTNPEVLSYIFSFAS